MAKAKTRGSWPPGHSGNPRGRPPKGRALSDMLLDSDPKDKEALVKMLWRKVRQGDLRAAEIILDRTEGKPPQRLAIAGDQTEPIVHEIHLYEEDLKPKGPDDLWAADPGTGAKQQEKEVAGHE